MSQTKYKLEPDVKDACISYVKGYQRRVKRYHQRKSEIISLTSEQCGIYNGLAEYKLQQLEINERLCDTRCMRAVEQALFTIGDDIESEEERENLVEAIKCSCADGKKFSFNYWNLKMSDNSFYKRRRAFLHEIASYMGYL